MVELLDMVRYFPHSRLTALQLNPQGAKRTSRKDHVLCLWDSRYGLIATILKYVVVEVVDKEQEFSFGQE